MVAGARPEMAIASTRFTRLVEKRVRRFITDPGVVGPGERLVVGVSGGADSSALLTILARCDPSMGFILTAAHFDHQLRARDEAAGDYRFVEALCQALGVELAVGSGDVPGYARHEKLSMEDAARKLRYRFLGQEARKSGSSVVAVGHTQDDRAETVLMHIIRGSGLDGLAAMPSRANWPFGDGPAIVRPLLEITREETERYCHESGIEPRDDPTNALPIATRNRVRLELMPLLRDFNPRVDEALARLAEAAAQDAEFMATTAEQEWARVADVSDRRVVFDAGELSALHPAVALRLLRRAAGVVAPASSPSAQQLRAVLEAAGKPHPSSAPLPGGVMVSVRRGRLTLEKASEAVDGAAKRRASAKG